MILCSTPSKHYLDAHYAKKYRLGASFSGSVALVPEATVEKIRFWQKSEAAQTDNLEVVQCIHTYSTSNQEDYKGVYRELHSYACTDSITQTILT